MSQAPAASDARPPTRFGWSPCASSLARLAAYLPAFTNDKIIVARALCVFLGLLLLRSAAAKLRRPEAFWSVLRRYPGGRVFRGAKLSRGVPALEILIAAPLLVPFPPLPWFSSRAALAFLLLATAGVFWRYLRGESSFACGCSHDLNAEMPVSGMLLRNSILLLSLLYALVAPWRPVGWLSYGLGAALLLAYEMLEVALLQEGRIRKWKALA